MPHVCKPIDQYLPSSLAEEIRGHLLGRDAKSCRIDGDFAKVKAALARFHFRNERLGLVQRLGYVDLRQMLGQPQLA